MFKELIDFVANSVRADEQAKAAKLKEAEDKTKAICKDSFTVERPAGTLVGPCQSKAAKHREREKHWTSELEVAEKELREKGVSMEVYDPSTAAYMNSNYTMIGSGNISNPGQTFQPRIDQKYMDAVKNAKQKMLEHRDRAAQYEKFARAYVLDPDRLIRLSVEDVHYFGLEG